MLFQELEEMLKKFVEENEDDESFCVDRLNEIIYQINENYIPHITGQDRLW